MLNFDKDKDKLINYIKGHNITQEDAEDILQESMLPCIEHNNFSEQYLIRCIMLRIKHFHKIKKQFVTLDTLFYDGNEILKHIGLEYDPRKLFAQRRILDNISSILTEEENQNLQLLYNGNNKKDLSTNKCVHGWFVKKQLSNKIKSHFKKQYK